MKQTKKLLLHVYPKGGFMMRKPLTLLLMKLFFVPLATVLMGNPLAYPQGIAV